MRGEKTRRFSTIFVGVLFLLTMLPLASYAEVPQSINYQGYLTDPDGNPVPDDDYLMEFSIYDQPTGSTPLWSESQSVTVTNGVYNVILGQPGNLLDPDDFDGDLYLGVTVEPDDEMQPRQKLTSVGYAFRAAIADEVGYGGVSTVMIQDGAVTSGKIADGAVTATIMEDGAALSEILDDDGAGSGLNADLLDGLHASAFMVTGADYGRSGVAADLYEGTTSLASKYVNESGDTMSGSSTGAVLSVTNSGTGYGLYGYASGSSGWGVYGKASGTGYGVYGQSSGGSGVYGFAEGDSGHGGFFYAGGTYGRGVWGYAGGGSGYGVYGYAGGASGYGGFFTSNNDHLDLALGGAVGRINTDPNNENSDLILSSNNDVMIRLDNDGGEDGVFRIKNSGDVDVCTVDETGNMYASGNVGIGTVSPQAKLHVAGNSQFDGVLGKNTYNNNYGTLGSGLYGVYGNSGIFAVYGENTNGNTGYLGGAGAGVYGEGSPWAGYFDGKVWVTGLQVTGQATVQVLQITGGSDLSEQFDIQSVSEELVPSPGMVVSIDPKNPGDLIVSNNAYDRRVAGIISGAGGIKPGMLMGQKGSEANGANPVALTGRVYCWVDASSGAIEAGDLLTTSDTPGHAMKVVDYTKAQGAILGKSMSSLESGQGLVLVLVTLQ